MIPSHSEFFWVRALNDATTSHLWLLVILQMFSVGPKVQRDEGPLHDHFIYYCSPKHFNCNYSEIIEMICADNAN
jgi:hypothetical protein